MVVYKKKLEKIQKFTIYFFIYSFLGWLLEVIFALFVLGTFVKRGFLYGPLCPIYGCGAVLLIFVLGKTNGKKTLEFFVSMIVFSIFEYFVSYILEMAFGLRWWDYTNDFLNLNGRISIAYSIAWGFIGVIFYEKIHPRIEKWLKKLNNKINYNIESIITAILVIITIVDFVFSTIKYLHI